MSKFCAICEKKNNPLFGEPLLLSDDSFLCNKCAKPISKNLTDLRYTMTESEFDSVKEKILSTAESNYPNFITKEIKELVDNIYQEIKDKLITPKEYIDVEKIEAAKRWKQQLDYMLTTGFNFEGYSIKKYITVISEEVVLGTGFLSEFTASFSDFFGTESNAFSNKIQEAKQAALSKLINKSIDLGGNAIIGIDFDHIMFRNNMIGVIVNGTCVQVEKIED